MASSGRRGDLLFLIDCDYIFVLRPNLINPTSRGTVLLSAHLRDVLCATDDGSCLHLALRPNAEFENLTKHGILAMQFDSEDTCLIVKQLIENKQEALKNIISVKIGLLLESCVQDSFDNLFRGTDAESPSKPDKK